MFPLVLPFHARHDKGSFSVPTLDQLSWFPAVILDWNDEARVGWAPGDLTPGQYLRQANPNQTKLAYIPAAYWWTARTMSPAAAPHRCAVQDLIIAGQHWLTKPDGSPLMPWRDQPLLSAAGIEIVDDYVRSEFKTAYWDGIHFDVLTPELLHLGATAEQSRASVQALREMIVDLRYWFLGDAIFQGNGSWEPFPEGDNPIVHFPGLDGAMVEKFPTYPAYATNGKPWPSQDARWSFHMDLAYVNTHHGWYAFHDDGIETASWFKNFVTSYAQGRRFVLASACLAGVWYTPPMRPNIPWADEMAVANGETVKSKSGVGWLGLPLQPSPDLPGDIEASGIITRQFEHGLVAVNPTISPRSIDIGQGWRRIRGWYDQVHNDGRRVDGQLTLQPYDAILLIRDGAPLPAPAPTPDPEPPIEVTPPVDDTRRQLLEQLHAAAIALQTAFDNNARCISQTEAARRAFQAALDALED